MFSMASCLYSGHMSNRVRCDWYLDDRPVYLHSTQVHPIAHPTCIVQTHLLGSIAHTNCTVCLHNVSHQFLILMMASPPRQPSTCFSCSRLNSSTFLIVEDDQWAEQPFIYAKIYSHVVVLVDTGCRGAARDASVELRSLRQFLETYPVPDNRGSPLNPGGDRAYAVMCNHCHYDHIGKTTSKCQAWPLSGGHVQQGG